MNDYYNSENQNKEEIEYEMRENHAKKISTRLLTIIQITVCAMIVITVVFLRFSGGNAYTVIKGWYVSNITQTIVPDEKIENVKNQVIELFPASRPQPAANSQLSTNSQSSTSSQKATGSQQSTSSRQTADSQKLIG